MKFRIGLAQCSHPADGDVPALVDDWACRAVESGVDILVFPECLMTPFEKTPEDYMASAQSLDEEFSQAIRQIAKLHGIWIVYTANERHPDGEPPYNTAVIADNEGRMRGYYRKTHLYDAHNVRESERMSSGERFFEPIDTPFGRIGLGICYDLRFPEVARAAACAGCELFILPAAWVDGPNKELHWKTLASARAIENEMYVAALSRVDEGRIGASLVVDPLGNVVAQAPAHEECLLVADVDRSEVASAREAMPVLDHRRADIEV